MLAPKLLPDRVRLLVIGGGIHGAGILHDLATRGWRDVLLVEKGNIGEGTSSRSTKLIHGGLRYLQHLRDFGLVREGLHERRLLMELASDLVKPVELLFPILRKGGMNGFMVRSGLILYDKLAGEDNIADHKKISIDEAIEKVPLLDGDKVKKVYSFWDGQTDDLRLTRRVVSSAIKLGASVVEGCKVLSISPDSDGWMVKVLTPDRKEKNISALHVINAAGPWANRVLEASQINPIYKGINIKGSHIMLDDIGLKAGLFLQAPDDGRIFFLLPWEKKTLIGTTESLYSGDQDQMTVTDEEINYLLSHSNFYLKTDLKKEDIVAKFSGLRWLALDPGRNIHATTRSYMIGEHKSGRGLLLTLYGGKLTAYRKLSELVGDIILRNYGEEIHSQTSMSKSWVTSSEEHEYFPPESSIEKRFVY